jgi:uncharacterized protein with FMN-binding domain
MRARTVKPIAALALTGVGTVLVVGFRTADPGLATSGDTAFVPSGVAATTPAPTTSGSSNGSGTGDTATSAPATSAPATATPGPTATQAPVRTYADGTWAGDAVQEPWGTFQVAAVIQDGQLVDVQYAGPGDRHSGRINRIAVPMLTQEAVAAQSASIDLLGGATWTSESYVYSLQSALDAAKAAVTAAS